MKYDLRNLSAWGCLDSLCSVYYNNTEKTNIENNMNWTAKEYNEAPTLL